MYNIHEAPATSRILRRLRENEGGRGSGLRVDDRTPTHQIGINITSLVPTATATSSQQGSSGENFVCHGLSSDGLLRLLAPSAGFLGESSQMHLVDEGSPWIFSSSAHYDISEGDGLSTTWKRPLEFRRTYTALFSTSSATWGPASYSHGLNL